MSVPTHRPLRLIKSHTRLVPGLASPQTPETSAPGHTTKPPFASRAKLAVCLDTLRVILGLVVTDRFPSWDVADLKGNIKQVGGSIIPAHWPSVTTLSADHLAFRIDFLHTARYDAVRLWRYLDRDSSRTAERHGRHCRVANCIATQLSR